MWVLIWHVSMKRGHHTTTPHGLPWLERRHVLDSITSTVGKGATWHPPSGSSWASVCPAARGSLTSWPSSSSTVELVKLPLKWIKINQLPPRQLPPSRFANLCCRVASHQWSGRFLGILKSPVEIIQVFASPTGGYMFASSGLFLY